MTSDTLSLRESAGELIERARGSLRTGAVAEALAALERAYDRAISSKDAAAEARALLETARALETEGSRDQALLCADQAIDAARRAALPGVEGEALLVEASVLASIGNAAVAAARLADAASKLDDAIGEAKARGDLEGALEASDLARRARDLWLAIVAGASGAPLPARVTATRAARRDDEARGRERVLLDLLAETARALASEDAPRFAEVLLDRAVVALGAERGFVLLSSDENKRAGPTEREVRHDSDAPRSTEGQQLARHCDAFLPGNLHVVAARNFDRASVRRADFKVSRAVIERALATRGPVVIADAGQDPGLSERSSVKSLRVRSIACVPFEAARGLEGTRGALYLDNRFAAGAFTAQQASTLAALGGQLAVAFGVTRAIDAAGSGRRELDRARAELDSLQQKLVQMNATPQHTMEIDARPTEALSAPAGIVTRSEAMQPVIALLSKVSECDLPVLVEGESGTGKELIARALHDESGRRERPFVSESCAAIPENLLESALFGHEPGAFTGATERRAGLFELAGSGTLFLDEVGELTASCQAKLLRVLQEKKVRRLGGSVEVPVEARIVCATNRDLGAMTRSGQFREDLYYRLKVISVKLPPLRERRDDIPLLVETFFTRSGVRPKIAPRALRALLEHDWPGNVRELENEVRRLVALGVKTIAVADLSPEVRGEARSLAASARANAPVETLEQGERRTILAALRAAGGNKARAAEILAIARGSLWHRIRQHRISVREILGL